MLHQGKPPHGYAMVNGTLLQGERFQTYARRNGLCDVCGRIMTHEKVGRFLQKELVPLSRMDAKGNYLVYKGMCIEPTCYTLEEAKRYLGELPAVGRKPKKTTKERTVHGPMEAHPNHRGEGRIHQRYPHEISMPTTGDIPSVRPQQTFSTDASKSEGRTMHHGSEFSLSFPGATKPGERPRRYPDDFSNSQGVEFRHSDRGRGYSNDASSPITHRYHDEFAKPSSGELRDAGQAQPYSNDGSSGLSTLQASRPLVAHASPGEFSILPHGELRDSGHANQYTSNGSSALSNLEAARQVGHQYPNDYSTPQSVQHWDQLRRYANDTLPALLVSEASKPVAHRYPVEFSIPPQGELRDAGRANQYSHDGSLALSTAQPSRPVTHRYPDEFLNTPQGELRDTGRTKQYSHDGSSALITSQPSRPGAHRIPNEFPLTTKQELLDTGRTKQNYHDGSSALCTSQFSRPVTHRYPDEFSNPSQGELRDSGRTKQYSNNGSLEFMSSTSSTHQQHQATQSLENVSPAHEKNSKTSNGTKRQELSLESPRLGAQYNGSTEEPTRRGPRNASTQDIPNVALPQLSPQVRTRRHVTVELEFERFTLEGNFVRFITMLESNQEAIVDGLELLRRKVYMTHTKGNSNQYVFGSDTWVKSLKSIMVDGKGNVDVQQAGIFTLWVLSAISQRYLNDIGKYGGVKLILSTLEQYQGHSSVHKVCCGALSLFLAHGQGGLDVPMEELEPAIRTLVNTIVNSGEENEKYWALRALVSLSQKASIAESEKSMLEFIRDTGPNGQGIHAIVKVAGGSSVPLAQAAMTLLWAMSEPSSRRTSDMVGVEEFIVAIKKIVDTSNDVAVLEDSLGVISNLLSQTDRGSNIGSSLDIMQQVVESIGLKISLFLPSKTVQIAGLHALCTVLHGLEKQMTFDLDPILFSVTETMNAHESHDNIQSLGCLALSCLCWTREDNFISVAARGGIEAVINVLRVCFTVDKISRFTLENAQSMVELVSNACRALTSMADSPRVMDELEESGILGELCNMMNGTLLATLPSGIYKRVLGVIERSGHGLQSVSHALDVVMNEQSSERDIENSIESIFKMSVKSPSTLDMLMSARDGRGVARIAEVMTIFEYSIIIRDSGCGLLAGVYARVPFHGKLNQRSPIESIMTHTHSVEEVKAIRACLLDQKTEDQVVGKALLALSNFLCGLPSTLALKSRIEIQGIFSGVLHDLVDVLGCHADNVELQTNGLRCVRVVLHVAEGMELTRWCSHIVESIISAMKDFKNHNELQLNACLSVLMLVDGVEVDMVLARVGRADGVNALLANLRTNDEELVDASSELISLLVKQVLAAVSEVVESDDSIEHIINCMFRFPTSGRIQANCSSILWSLATLHDHYVKGVITSSGGVAAILEAMRNHQDDERVQEYGCKALEVCSTSMPKEGIGLARNDLAIMVHNAMENNVMNDEIEKSAFNLVGYLCGMDDFFTRFFSNARFVTLVVQAMKTHVEKQGLQFAGVTVFWTLSSFGDNKRLIGECGGLRVLIDALLCHIAYKQIQEDGMKVLKNLATTTSNKGRIKEMGGQEAIVWSMWVNMDSPTILAASFSALNNVAVDTENRIVAPMTAEILSCILVAMRRFPQSIVLQENACFLLKSYTFSPSNLVIMGKRRVELVQVLTLTLSLFPGTECGNRAEFILCELT